MSSPVDLYYDPKDPLAVAQFAVVAAAEMSHIVKTRKGGWTGIAVLDDPPALRWQSIEDEIELAYNRLHEHLPKLVAVVVAAHALAQTGGNGVDNDDLHTLEDAVAGLAGR